MDKGKWERTAGGSKQLTGRAVTVNQKTISRRSFSQVVHIGGEDNFSRFLVA
jgi:hypothetical protein